MSQDLPQPTTSEHLAGPDERSARRARRAGGVPSPSWRSSPAAPRRPSRPRSATRRAPRTARSSTRRAVSRSRVPSRLSTGTTTDPAAAACSATARRTRGKLRHDAGAEPDDLDRDEQALGALDRLLEANGPAASGRRRGTGTRSRRPRAGARGQARRRRPGPHGRANARRPRRTRPRPPRGRAGCREDARRPHSCRRPGRHLRPPPVHPRPHAR